MKGFLMYGWLLKHGVQYFKVRKIEQVRVTTGLNFEVKTYLENGLILKDIQLLGSSQYNVCKNQHLTKYYSA